VKNRQADYLKPSKPLVTIQYLNLRQLYQRKFHQVHRVNQIFFQALMNHLKLINNVVRETAIHLMKQFIAIHHGWNKEYVFSQSIEYWRKELFNIAWFYPKDLALYAIELLIENGTDKDYWIQVKEHLKALPNT